MATHVAFILGLYYIINARKNQYKTRHKGGHIPGGDEGIRTLDTVAGILHFQCSALDQLCDVSGSVSEGVIPPRQRQPQPPVRFQSYPPVHQPMHSPIPRLFHAATDLRCQFPRTLRPQTALEILYKTE